LSEREVALHKLGGGLENWGKVDDKSGTKKQRIEGRKESGTETGRLGKKSWLRLRSKTCRKKRGEGGREGLSAKTGKEGARKTFFSPGEERLVAARF